MRDKGKIGIQGMMLKEIIAADGVYETMRKCADMGYRCIEISQIPMTEENVAAFARAREDFGLQIAALSATVSAARPGAECLENDYDKIVADCRTLGCNILRMGMGPVFEMKSPQDVLDFCRRTEPYVQRLKADGIDYYYHNHAYEFRKFGGRTLLDTIRDETSMGFELDIHWIHTGGCDPVSVLRDYAGRIRLVHLKDYRIGCLPENYRQLQEEGLNPQYMAIEYAEVGEGSLDIRGCIQAGLEGGAEYFLIEQDKTYDKTPLEALQISHDNLVEMGYGEWF